MSDEIGDDERAQAVTIDPGAISADALRGLVEEFVTRSGTDYGARECPLEQKTEQVLGQVERGEVRVVFDPETGTANLVPADDAPPA